MKAINFKFLNRSPMILGFEFEDCLWAITASGIYFEFFKNHFFSLIIGFAVVILKSSYKKFYPKNTIYFQLRRTKGVKIQFLLRKIPKESALL